jgi:hypothetical protein
MKKIYLSIAALAVAVGAVAQTAKAPTQGFHKGTLAPGAKVPYSMNKSTQAPLQKSAGGPVHYQLDPIEQVMIQKGLDLTSANPNQDIYITGLHQDSTVMFSSSSQGTRAISDMFLGSILDPKSTYLQNTFQPLLSAADAYTIDSVYILGSYVKKTAAIDTLYVWFVWGDTTTTSPAFSKITTGTAWVAPISGWRKNILCPKVQGAVAGPGNKVTPSAPSTNKYLQKYVLQPVDSVTTNGRIRYIEIPLTTPVSVPANNVVSCFYTFAPGGAYSSGQVAYTLGGSPQVINGFAAAIWGQNNPALTQLSDYADHQVDATSWNMGVSYDKRGRHAAGSATYNNRINGDLTQSPIIVYAVSGTSTVGMKELENKGFVLGQNVPNPFNGQSTVTYNIDKEATSAVFTVTDVMGRVISTEKADASKGTHTITLGNHSAGVYYYSLNVDGNVTTKKMIAQ